MIPASNGSGAIFALFLLIQLGGVLAFLAGGWYLLSVLNRSAKALERLAELSAIQMARHDAFYLKDDSVPSQSVENQAPPAPAQPVSNP